MPLARRFDASPGCWFGRVSLPSEVVGMKAFQQFSLLLLLLGCAGCAHTSKLARLYVPMRCIQKVRWTRPCASVSEHLVKCDGVMVTTSCVAARTEPGAALDRTRLPHN